MKMHCNETKQFKKDVKKLKKKYKTLDSDIQEFLYILRKKPLGIGNHFNVLTEQDTISIVKARFFCRSLKGKHLRIIYAYDNSEVTLLGITFIELYAKNDKEREDTERINNYLSEKM